MEITINSITVDLSTLTEDKLGSILTNADKKDIQLLKQTFHELKIKHVIDQDYETAAKYRNYQKIVSDFLNN